MHVVVGRTWTPRRAYGSAFRPCLRRRTILPTLCVASCWAKRCPLDNVKERYGQSSRPGQRCHWARPAVCGRTAFLCPPSKVHVDGWLQLGRATWSSPASWPVVQETQRVRETQTSRPPVNLRRIAVDGSCRSCAHHPSFGKRPQDPRSPRPGRGQAGFYIEIPTPGAMPAPWRATRAPQPAGGLYTLRRATQRERERAYGLVAWVWRCRLAPQAQGVVDHGHGGGVRAFFSSPVPAPRLGRRCHGQSVG